MPREAQQVTHLYRIENPNIYNEPDNVIWLEELRGQWFFDDIRNTRGYINQVVRDRSHTGQVVDGAQLVIAHIPSDEVEDYRAINHPVASKMQCSVELDYIVPRDGTVAMTTLNIDRLLGNLRFSLFDRRKFLKGNNLDRAQGRIEHLSKLAVLAWDIRH